MYCERNTTMSLVNICQPTSLQLFFVLVMRTSKIYSVSNVHIYCVINHSYYVVHCILSIYLITESMYSLAPLPFHSLPTPCLWQPPSCSLYALCIHEFGGFIFQIPHMREIMVFCLSLTYFTQPLRSIMQSQMPRFPPFLQMNNIPLCVCVCERERESVCASMSMCMLSHVQLFVTPWTSSARPLCPWNFPGKNPLVGCHFLLQGIFIDTPHFLYPFIH